jgi:hypothetical protein
MMAFSSISANERDWIRFFRDRALTELSQMNVPWGHGSDFRG